MSNDDNILQMVNKIYSESPKPVYISRIGQQLRRMGGAISGSLKKYIEENYADRYIVLQHKSIKEKLALSTWEDKETTEMLLNDTKQCNPEIANITRLPRSFLIPFCKGDSDKEFYVNTSHPFHYTTSKPMNEGSYVIVEQEFRCDMLLPINILKIDQDKLQNLMSNIDRWAEKHAVKLDSISTSAQEVKNLKVMPSTLATTSKTALDRLIEAQPPHNRSSFVIPMDIIVLLNKH